MSEVLTEFAAVIVAFMAGLFFAAARPRESWALTFLPPFGMLAFAFLLVQLV